jgi:hypothetical protein
MPRQHSYCWWCGKWRELPFYAAICDECHESKCAH